MGGSAIGLDLKYGFVGAIARHGDEVIKSRPVHSGANPISFGAPVVLYANAGATDGTIVGFGASNTAVDFIGVACRKVKQPTNFVDENFGKYYDTDICDVMERGSISVLCPTGNPQPGGTVYIRTALNANYPNAQIGDFEAVADAGNQITLSNAKFYGFKDADDVVELVILERQGV